MFCRKCGKEILDDAIICISCGRSTQSVSIYNSIKSQQTYEPWDGGVFTALIIGSIVFPLIGLTMFLLNKENPARESQSNILLIVFVLMFIVYGTQLLASIID